MSNSFQLLDVKEPVDQELFDHIMKDRMLDLYFGPHIVRHLLYTSKRPGEAITLFMVLKQAWWEQHKASYMSLAWDRKSTKMYYDVYERCLYVCEGGIRSAAAPSHLVLTLKLMPDHTYKLITETQFMTHVQLKADQLIDVTNYGYA